MVYKLATCHRVVSDRRGNIRFGRMSIIQRVNFPGRWVRHLLIYVGAETVSSIWLG